MISTLIVSHTNVFGSDISDDVWIRYIIPDNEDPMFEESGQ